MYFVGMLLSITNLNVKCFLFKMAIIMHTLPITVRITMRIIRVNHLINPKKGSNHYLVQCKLDYYFITPEQRCTNYKSIILKLK